MNQSSRYTEAGVDINAGDRVKKEIAKRIRQTHTSRVLHKEGAFGALFSLTDMEMEKPTLVSSVDGGGTKTKVAIAMGQHRGIGADIVNHSIDDILTCGAKPLFFLDYFACGKQDDQVVLQLIEGMTESCSDAGMALIGGETAQMPDVYAEDEYDLAGSIVGIVDENRIVDGRRIEPGDAVIGLPSDGLHTNGYTLARTILIDEMGLDLKQTPKGLSRPLGNELLIPHKSYLHEIEVARETADVLGIAHITGGGFEGNISRSLPDGCGAEIDLKTWTPPAIFQLIQNGGSIPLDEMYRVFNMGIGMVLVVRSGDADRLLNRLIGSQRVGEIVVGSGVELIG